MCGTIGFRKAGARVVGIFGFVGAQASHKGTGMTEIGSKAVLMRFSFIAGNSGGLVSGGGRFFSEAPTDISVAVRSLLVAGGVV